MPHCMGFGLHTAVAPGSGCADTCVSASQPLSAPHATTGAVPSPSTAVPSPGGGPSTGGGAPAPSTTTGPRGSALKVRCGLVRIYWGHCLPLSCWRCGVSQALRMPLPEYRLIALTLLVLQQPQIRKRGREEGGTPHRVMRQVRCCM